MEEMGMTITWIFDAQGGFIVRSEQGNYDYAYPTSPHAKNARKDPAHIASVMARKADANAEIYPFAERNEHLRNAAYIAAMQQDPKLD
jgi:hypothetical protein